MPTRPLTTVSALLGTSLWILLGALALSFTTTQEAAADTDFVRADANGDGRVSISDALTIRRFLFNGDAALLSCLDAGDVDDSGSLMLDDVVQLLVELFFVPTAEWGTDPFPAPFPTVGPDPTTDDT